VQDKFDLLVIGSGTAGSTVASKCRAAGWSVAIIDSLPFGGTCALRGCDPKKVLVGTAELLDFSTRLQEKRTVTGKLTIDWRGLSVSSDLSRIQYQKQRKARLKRPASRVFMDGQNLSTAIHLKSQDSGLPRGSLLSPLAQDPRVWKFLEKST
jgi:pyruvate/2-oxoglutarate dehydrogenase complex dihydrolipoamide dehydrogenase (E3) component